MSDKQIFDCAQGVGTCLACGKNFECGATKHRSYKGNQVGYKYFMEAQDFTLEGWVHIPIKRGNDMPKQQEIYHSSTLGPIPLSFTGRRLMQNLRDEFQRLLSIAIEKTKRGEVGVSHEWERVSEARGRIAQHMSQLENKILPSHQMRELETLRHENEVLRKANEAFKLQEARRGRRTVVNVMDFNSTMDIRPIHFGRLARPQKHEYFVRVLEGNFKANKRHERQPGSIITTEVQIGGSMQVTAFTSDDALDMAVAQAHKHGFTELTKKDFEVRYLGPVEAL